MTVLVLSGTREGRDIARALQARGVAVTASLAGATRSPRDQHVATRIGGFGGSDGFLRYLQDAGIRAVVDATHPFAARITARSARLCAEIGMPYCLYLRAQWEPEKGDTWVTVQSEREAAQHIPVGATVFLATGRQTLDRFAGLEGRYLICRQIDAPDTPFPFENGEFLQGIPPFSVKEEVLLFEKRKVDWLVVKNAGGVASRSKLIAARHLGVPVVMIARPPLPECVQVANVQGAVDWAVRAHG